LHVTFENLVESFEANALEGKVWLNPNAISAGSETEVSGQQLLQHHNFFKLMQPQKRISDVDRLSADEFFEQNKDILGDKRTPPLIQARQGRTQATTEHFQKAREATAHAGSTSVTDYPADETGYPNYPSKYSLRRLLESLSAEDYQKRLNEDRQFAAAIDKLQNGNK